jgi:GntR family transcriptional regulator
VLEFRIQPGGSTPLYRQIVDQVRWAVTTSIHDAGNPLPSVRVLAEQLVINPNTVARAYAELVRDGVIEARPGKGYFICKRRQVYSKEERQRRIGEVLDEFVKEALFLDFAPAEIRQALDQKLSDLPLRRKGGYSDGR